MAEKQKWTETNDYNEYTEHNYDELEELIIIASQRLQEISVSKHFKKDSNDYNYYYLGLSRNLLRKYMESKNKQHEEDN